MIGKSHATFGVGCFLLTTPLIELPFNEALIFIPFALLGSLAPDLDAGNSKLKSNLLIWILTLPLSFFGHRTWSHSLLMIGLLSIPVFYYEELPAWALTAWIAFIVGYASHILGDFMTPMGVPLLYPWSKKFSSPITFRTGSFFEFFIALIPLGSFFVLLSLNS